MSPIPNGQAGPVGVTRVYSIPIYVPSDVVSLNRMLIGNRKYDAGTGSAISTDIALYASDGSEKPSGSSLRTVSAFSIPGDGTLGNLGAFPVTRGSDGKIVALHSFPDPVFARSPNTELGAFQAAASVVDPPPALSSGVNPNPNYWHTWEFMTAKRRIIVLTDSIGLGYLAGFSVSCWQEIASGQDFAVCIVGVVEFGSLVNFADRVTYPFLWDYVSDIAGGADLVIQLGTNDLSYNNAATMTTHLGTIITYAKSIGIRRVYGWTVPPQTSFPGTDAARATYNTSTLANPNFTGVYNAAATLAGGGLASNADVNVLDVSFSVDGTHINAAGNDQAKTGYLAII